MHIIRLCLVDHTACRVKKALPNQALSVKNCCICRDGRAGFDEAVAVVPLGEVISTTIRFISPSVKYLRQLRFSYHPR
jgi:hypothetical protein